MYYKSVNRGLSFTKQGIYLFFFSLLVGMLAVVTGINGFYIILCASLGIFVLSGILSERVFRSCHTEMSFPAVLSSDEALEIRMTVENRGWAGIYSLESLVLVDYPRYKIIKGDIESVAKDCVELESKSSVTRSLMGVALPRGLHTQFVLMQQTVFPFGILEKYRFKKESTEIFVYPKVNRKFLEYLNETRKFSNYFGQSGVEFFGHERFDFHNWRKLDWKRNAFKRQSDWVVKVFKDEKNSDRIIIRADWIIAQSCRASWEYEEYLENITTFILHTRSCGYKPTLVVTENHRMDSLDSQLRFLALCPSYSHRDKIKIPPIEEGVSLLPNVKTFAFKDYNLVDEEPNP